MAMARSPMTTIRRRVQRPTPMSRLRLGASPRGAAAALPFPGIHPTPPEGRGPRASAALFAAALHAALFAGLLALVWMAPPKEEEEVIPIELVKLEPPPPPPPPPKVEKVVERPPTPAPAPVPAPKPAPAPAPKALAERRSVNFEPSAQAIAPQVVNPSVIQRASPSIEAKTLDVAALQSSVSAPTEIKATGIAVQTVSAVTNVGVPSAPRAVDVGSVSAPAVRGPVQSASQVGAMVGPKAIASPVAGSVGAGTVVRSGDGSSVREGAVTGRDVLGSADGERLASVDTRVGQGNLRGTGEGTTLGGDVADCDARPEVKAYHESVRQRTLARWVAPPGMQGSAKATLSWRLDVSGSATSVRLVNASNDAVGNSVVEALRAASPFPPMSDRVRCLTNRTLTGTFMLIPERG